MKENKYTFDKDNFSFKEYRRSAMSVIFSVARILLFTAIISVVMYVFFSSFLNTETEKALKRENKAYSALYDELSARVKLNAGVIENLHEKDNGIYKKIFHTPVPPVSIYSMMEEPAAEDTNDIRNVINKTHERILKLYSSARKIDKDFEEIMKLSSVLENIPVYSPVEDLSYTQIGASVGKKLNPFYKVTAEHTGLDIVAGPGQKVYPSAKGVVRTIRRDRKGLGNMVEIDHENGFVSRYGHLSDIKVLVGSRVNRNTEIATIGVSGTTFVPHLHYELMYGDKILNPVYYLFGSLSPEDYHSSVLMSFYTRQSLD